MAYQTTGLVRFITPTTEITSQKTGQIFRKRELVLDCTRYDQYTGERSKYTNTPKFDFLNDKCELLDNLNLGDVVTVHWTLDGNSYTNKEGRTDIINSIQGFKVELRNIGQKQQQQQPTYQPPQPQRPNPLQGTPYAQQMDILYRTQQPLAPPPPTTGDPNNGGLPF